MKRNLITSVLAVLVFTVLLGLVYPLAVTGVAQVAFGSKADGDPNLIAQARTQPVLGSRRPAAAGRRRQRRHRARPGVLPAAAVADGLQPQGTFFSNRGPNQASARYFYRDQLAAYLALNGPYNPGLTNAGVPADAVTTSGSGVDPHISEDNARIQARRVAAVRNLPLEQVEQLVDDNTDGRFLGVLGEPGVNTTKLNKALEGR